MHVVLQRRMKGFFRKMRFWHLNLFQQRFNNQNQTKPFEFDVLAEILLDFSFRGLQL